MQLKRRQDIQERTPSAARTGLWIALAVVAATAVLALSAAADGSWFERLLAFVRDGQRSFSRDLAAAVRNLDGSEAATALWSLVGLGFLYGVFHAIGPGHGKTVITAYALTHESRAARTAGLAVASALIQGVSAIVVVLGAAWLIDGGLRRATHAADRLLEQVSYGAVLLIGCYLSAVGVRAFWRHLQVARDAVAAQHDCGHSHGPTPEQVARASSWQRAALVAVAVGIRPCSGAILVLVLALALGHPWSGIGAVFAMSAGTAITVAALAITAQGARWPVLRVFEAAGMRAAPVAAAIALLGGGVIVLLGATLLAGTFGQPVHPLGMR